MKAEFFNLASSVKDRLAISKLAAGREKGLSFVTAMLRHGLVNTEHIQSVFGELTEAWLQHLRPRLTRCQAEILR